MHSSRGKHRKLILCGIFCLSATLVLWLVHLSRQGEPYFSDTTPTTDALNSEQPENGALPLRTNLAEPQNEFTAEAVLSHSDEPSTAEFSPSGGRWSIEITVLPQPTEASDCRVSVIPFNENHSLPQFSESWRQFAAETGGFHYADVSEFYSQDYAPFSGLEITVEQKGYRKEVVRTSSRNLGLGARSQGVYTNQSAMLTVSLKPSNSLCGRALDEADLPVSGADIWLLPIHEGTPLFEPLAHTQTDDTGNFCIEAPIGGDLLIAAIHSDYKPRSTKFPRSSEGGANHIEFTLRPGLNADVLVSFGDSELGKVHVELRRAIGKGMRLGSEYLAWDEGALKRFSLKLPVGGEVPVQFSGLHAGEYLASLGQSGSSKEYGYALSHARQTKSVTLPQSAPVIFEPPVAHLQVTIIRREHVRTQVALTQDGIVRAYARPDKDNSCTFVLAPLTTYGIQAISRDCASDVVIVHSAAEGQMSKVDLSCKENALGRCLITIANEQGTVRSIDFELLRLGGIDTGSRKGRIQPNTFGKFVISDIEPGEYRLTTHPNGRFNSATPILTPHVDDLSVREGEDSTIRLRFQPGGTIQVRVKDQNGDGTRSSCQVLSITPSGYREIPIILVNESEGEAPMITESTSEGGWVRAYPALPRGEYRVVLSRPGYHPFEKTITLEEREVEFLEANLTIRED